MLIQCLHMATRPPDMALSSVASRVSRTQGSEMRVLFPGSLKHILSALCPNLQAPSCLLMSQPGNNILISLFGKFYCCWKKRTQIMHVCAQLLQSDSLQSHGT